MAAVGHIVFHHDVISAIKYVTFIARVKQMLKFTFKFTLTFTCAFLLRVITWVHFMLKLGPGAGLGVKLYMGCQKTMQLAGRTPLKT